jgi:putative transposase
VCLTINGERHYLSRAADQGGNILDILVQRRRNRAAAKKFFRKLLKGLSYIPREIVTDRLKSDGAATRATLPSIECRQHRDLNNRAENSHQPTRQRERLMHRVKLPSHMRRFLSAYGPSAQHFRPHRYCFAAPEYRHVMRKRVRDGGNSRAWLYEGRARCSPPTSLPGDGLGTDKLTTPCGAAPCRSISESSA